MPDILGTGQLEYCDRAQKNHDFVTGSGNLQKNHQAADNPDSMAAVLGITRNFRESKAISVLAHE